jgi:hypothetical protein
MNFLDELSGGAKFLSAYLRKKVICHYRPPMVLVEPTNNCNVKCIMCPHDKMLRQKGYMDFDLYKKLIKNNRGFIINLNLFLMGEPLLHPRIAEMASYARSFNIRTSIFTNATLIDKEKCQELLLSGINLITISFEGLEGHYESIRIGANYKKVIDNIKNLVSMKNSLKIKSPQVIIKFINFNYKAQEIKKFVGKMKEIGVDKVWEVPLHGWPDFRIEKDEVNAGGRPFSKKYYPCVLPWSTMSVLWDGKVVGCCDDFEGKFVIGSINETPDLSKIWNSPKMISLRTKLAGKEYADLELCRICDRIGKPPFKYPIFQNAMWGLKERLP